MTLSPALVERILAEQKTGSSRRARRWRAALPLGAAVAAVACLIALVLAPLPWRLERVSPGIDRGRPAGRASGSALRPSNRQADSRVLSEALADATAASWDLARTTSEPAARLGRQVLESATRVENPSRAGIRRLFDAAYLTNRIESDSATVFHALGLLARQGETAGSTSPKP